VSLEASERPCPGRRQVARMARPSRSLAAPVPTGDVLVPVELVRPAPGVMFDAPDEARDDPLERLLALAVFERLDRRFHDGQETPRLFPHREDRQQRSAGAQRQAWCAGRNAKRIFPEDDPLGEVTVLDAGPERIEHAHAEPRRRVAMCDAAQVGEVAAGGVQRHLGDERREDERSPPRGSCRDHRHGLRPSARGPGGLSAAANHVGGDSVNLASHLVNDAHRGLFEAAAVVSCDTDLVEPVRIVAKQLRLPVCLLPPQIEGSRSLKGAATEVRQIGNARLRQAQFPDEVIVGNGNRPGGEPAQRPNPQRMVSGRTKAAELERLLPWAWQAERLGPAVNA
jgi:hypothetical protein